MKSALHRLHSTAREIPFTAMLPMGERKNNKPGIYLLVYDSMPRKTGGAWVLDGILRYFGSEEGRAYRENALHLGYAMVDVDSVLYGAYRKGSSGWRYEPRVDVQIPETYRD